MYWYDEESLNSIVDYEVGKKGAESEKFQKIFSSILGRPSYIQTIQSKSILFERELLQAHDDTILLFDFLSTKSFKTSQAKNNNQVLVVVMKSGEVVFRSV